MKQDRILIIDLGGVNNTEIARKVREHKVYSEIYPHDINKDELSKLSNIKGIILNGGPNCVVDGVKIDPSKALYDLNVPMFDNKYSSDKGFSNDEVTLDKEMDKFLFEDCKAEPNWNIENFINEQVALIKEQVQDKKVLLALSGGVDSSVVAALLLKAIGENLVCVHVNHGLLRKGEPEQVISVFREMLHANLIYVEAIDRFLDKLKDVSDPEEKRKIIGFEFIKVFDEEANKLEGIDFLAQGTIYPDIIESGTKTVKAVKSHHNVGGLPEDMKFELVEPLKMLFKDEVRECGVALGLPYDMVYRQPFPGPGLGVRCLGAITRDRLEAVRESDAILREEFEIAGLNKKVWQYFTAIPDFKSVGVKNHERSYEWSVIVRAVNTVDAMSAEIEEIPYSVLKKITDRITHEVKGVNRVVYDLTPKPSGTIEWE